MTVMVDVILDRHSDFALHAISSPIWISELLLGVCLDPSLRRSHRGYLLVIGLLFSQNLQFQLPPNVPPEVG